MKIEDIRVYGIIKPVHIGGCSSNITKDDYEPLSEFTGA